jgi:hypothetical protein
VAYLKQFSTDRFESQVQAKPIIVTDEDLERIAQASSKTLPAVPRRVKPWSETEYRRKVSGIKILAGLVLVLIIVGITAWAAFLSAWY